MIRKTLLLSIVFCLPTLSFAAITFDGNGKWETTFDCAEQTQFVGTLDCDGMNWSGDYSTDGHVTTIESSANNPSGLGGYGAKFWKNDGENANSGTIAVTFPSAQDEVWVRWYERYQSGFQWGASTDVKSLYFKATGSNPYVGYQYGNYRMYWGGSLGPWPAGAAGGWDDVYGTASDGTWHCFEVYMKMDTNGANGIGRLWVDGVLVAEETTIDFGTISGWDYFNFLSNQKYPDNGEAMYVDFDDMVVYNTTPPNTDDDGNAYIGPLGETSSTPSITGIPTIIGVTIR